MKEEKHVNSKIISRITEKEDCIMIQLIGISGLKLDSKKLPDDSPVTVDTTFDNANEEMDDENDTTRINNEFPMVFYLDIVAVLVFGKSGDGDT